MKALSAILVELRQPLAIEEIEIPKLQFGQVLVQVLYSGICGSQLGEIEGVKGGDSYLPHLLGHEGSGIVIDCGPGVKKVEEEDNVVMHWRQGAGIQSETPKYRSKTLGIVNAGWVTTFNEYAIVSENRLTVIPVEFDMKTATLFGCAVTTGFGVINNNAKVKIGESVVIWGAGGVGLSIVQGAALASAYPIIALDLFENRLALARTMGATSTININNADVDNEIKKIIGDGGADVVIDNTGNTDIIEKCYETTNSRGRTVLVGVPITGSKASIFTLPLHFEKTITGSHGGESNPDIDIPNYIKLLDNTKIEVKQMITSDYRLEDINSAFDDMRTGTLTGRGVISMA